MNNGQIASPTLARYADLLIDAHCGKITLAQAEALADKRFKLEVGFDEDEYAIQNRVAASRKFTAGGNIATKGLGHRTLGARNHGKSTVCTAGAGYGRYDALRLQRVEGGVALEGKTNHRVA